MDKKLLTPKDGFRAIAQMTPNTRRFLCEELGKIMEEAFAGYKEDES